MLGFSLLGLLVFWLRLVDRGSGFFGACVASAVAVSGEVFLGAAGFGRDFLVRRFGCAQEGRFSGSGVGFDRA